MGLLNIQLCKAFLCFTWSSENDKIILRCKTNTLRFPVSFYSPSGEEVASCDIPFPQPLCHSLMPNISVDQDIRTHTTTLTYSRYIASSLHGEWKCKYGKNLETGSVNITAMQIKDRLIKKEENDLLTENEEVSCEAFFRLSMIGFVAALSQIWTVRCCSRMLLSTLCKQRLSGMKATELRSLHFVVMMAIMGSLGSLIGLPFLVETQCKDCCDAVGKGLFVLFGSVVGILINVLTDILSYVQIYETKWMQNDNPKARLSTKESEKEAFDMS